MDSFSMTGMSSRLLPVFCSVVVLASCAAGTTASPDVVLTSDDPVEFSTEGLDVSLTKQEITPAEFTDYLVQYAGECGPERPEGYYNELATVFMGIRGMRYTLTERKEPMLQHSVAVIPNSMQYKDMESFRNDFFSCGAGGEFPFALNDRWLVFVSSCGGVDERCAQFEEKVRPTIRLR